MDHAQWKALTRKAEEPVKSRLEYKTVSQSTAWNQLLEWVDEQIGEKGCEGKDITNNFMASRVYGHEALVTYKALLDIVQGEKLMLESVKRKMEAYRQQEG